MVRRVSDPRRRVNQANAACATPFLSSSGLCPSPRGWGHPAQKGRMPAFAPSPWEFSKRALPKSFLFLDLLFDKYSGSLRAARPSFSHRSQRARRQGQTKKPCRGSGAFASPPVSLRRQSARSFALPPEAVVSMQTWRSWAVWRGRAGHRSAAGSGHRGGQEPGQGAGGRGLAPPECSGESGQCLKRIGRQVLAPRPRGRQGGGRLPPAGGRFCAGARQRSGARGA